MKTFVRSATHARNLCGSLLVGSLLLSSQAAAQSGGELIADGALRFNVPVHEEPGLDGQTEIWASRDDYKVSFHDGIAFYPVLGTTHERNLPVTWRTSSVRANGRELLVDGAAPRAESSAWRFELHHGAIVEAYDVREDGLEQTFVLDAPLGGDLEIRGSLASELVGDTLLAPAHDEILFRDAAGNPIVSYGAVTVVDAAGDTAPMHTSFDGREITLHVDGDWLRDAVYPVVVDPLMTSQVILTTQQNSANPSVARSPNALLFMDSRATSASDYDTIGVRAGADFSNPTVIFSVLSASANHPHTRAAYVALADRWCIAMEVQTVVIGRPYQTVGWHLRRPSDVVFQTVNNHTLFGTNNSQPAVGGEGGSSFVNNKAVIVFKSGTGTQSAIRAAVIDCANESLVTTTQLSDVNAMSCEFPDVNEQAAHSQDRWAVVWQEEGAATRRHLRMSLVRRDGSTTLPHSLGHQNDLTKHNFKPKIDGNAGRFAVAFVVQPVGGTVSSDPTGSELWVDQIRVGLMGTQTFEKTHTALVRIHSGFYLSTSAMTYDSDTESHWGIAYETRYSTGTLKFSRVGFDGLVTEAHSLGTGRNGVAATYVPGQQVFAVVYSDGATLRARKADYPIIPTTSIGASCGSGQLDSDTSHAGSPYAGKDGFALRLSGIQEPTSAILLLGVQAINVPILGCRIYVNPLVSVPFATTTALHELEFSIPSNAQGPLVSQIAWVGSNSGTFGMTNGYSFTIQ